MWFYLLLFSIILFFALLNLFLIIKFSLINKICSSISNCVIVFSKNEKIIYFNDVFLKKFGFNKNNKIYLKDIFYKNDINTILKNKQYHFDSQKNFIWRAFKKTGEEFLVNVTFKKIIKTSNKLIAIITDIAEYETAEKKLRESQRLISTMISNIPGIIYLAKNEKQRKMQFISEGGLDLTGYYPNDIIDNNVITYDKLIHHEDREYVKKELKKAIKKNSSYLITYRIKTASGNEKWVMEKGRPILSASKNLLAIGGVISDITDYKKMEKALADEKERLSITLKSIGDAVITTDIKGNVVLLNNAAEKLTGWALEEAKGKNLELVFNIIHEDSKKPYKNFIMNIIKNKKTENLNNNTLLISKNGSEKTISETSTPINDQEGNIIGVVIVFRDITEKNKIDEEMRKIQKLESLGVLAGGIAHDFNNLLTIILGYINLARYYSKDNKDLKELLLSAEKGIYNSKKLTDQLLTFAKGGTPIKKVGPINKILQDSVSFSLRGSNVISNLKIDENLYLLNFDEGQLSQVFNNLTINARQAMQNGGKLEVIAENYIFKNNNNKSKIKQGEYVRIIFNDNGHGIPAQYLPKIFDPFFTTKNTGKGLGLATVYSIIKKHNGFIEASSTEGAGTNFIIYLPKAKKNNNDLIEINKDDIILKGQGNILYMDDDEIILEMAEKTLKFLGYNVDLAKNGYSAIEKYEKAKNENNPYDCVILDLTIPGSLGGKETIKHLLTLDPKIKAIVTSGYSNDRVLSNFKNYGFKGVVIKPFTIKKFSEILNSILKN